MFVELEKLVIRILELFSIRVDEKGEANNKIISFYLSLKPCQGLGGR